MNWKSGKKNPGKLKVKEKKKKGKFIFKFSLHFSQFM
jgi:hypothetical protein